MADFLDVLARDAKSIIARGYYETTVHASTSHVSLRRAILESKTIPLITELKAASPSAGIIREKFDAGKVAEAMEKGGAVGISVLTEPLHFHGSLTYLAEVRKTVNLPILMKDIIVSPLQLEAASKTGANAALLIKALFDRNYCACGVDEMIANAHSKGIEVLLETHTEDEFQSAVNTEADMVGINNRNLGTLRVDLNITKKILEKNDAQGKVVVSESGINTPADLRFLRGCGADAFLVGSAVMLSENVEEKVKELVSGL